MLYYTAQSPEATYRSLLQSGTVDTRDIGERAWAEGWPFSQVPNQGVIVRLNHETTLLRVDHPAAGNKSLLQVSPYFGYLILSAEEGGGTLVEVKTQWRAEVASFAGLVLVLFLLLTLMVSAWHIRAVLLLFWGQFIWTLYSGRKQLIDWLAAWLQTQGFEYREEMQFRK